MSGARRALRPQSMLSVAEIASVRGVGALAPASCWRSCSVAQAIVSAAGLEAAYADLKTNP